MTQSKRAGRDVCRPSICDLPDQLIEHRRSVGDAGQDRHDVHAGIDSRLAQTPDRAQPGVRCRRPRFDAPREVIDRLANRYYAIVSRCKRGPGVSGPRYAGRGIDCLFTDVYEFVGYCLALPGVGDPDLEIDRINNNGNYEPGNLRFTTRKVQCRNKEVLRWITYRGETMCATEFWERYAPQYRSAGTVGRKAAEGLSAEQIIADQANCRGPYIRHI